MRIYPKKMDISSETRLVIYNMNMKKFDKIEIIPSNSFYEIEDDSILNNLADFKYKLQIKNDNKWTDKTKYMKLYNDKILDELFNDISHISLEEFKKTLEIYWDNYSINHIPEIRTAFANSMRNIWNNPDTSHNNLNLLIEISKDTNTEIPLLWKNILFYIEEVLNLNKALKHFGLSNFSFQDINNGITLNDIRLHEYINSRIFKLEQINLEFSTLFIGLYYSYIGKRNLAIKAFNKSHEFEENYIKSMKIDIGSYTYTSIVDGINYTPEIVFHDSLIENRTGITILLSMDAQFLKYYSIQLFYSIIALRNYHFHFHIVDYNNTSNDAIKEAKSLYENLIDYIRPKSPITAPTFSYEIYPEFVKDSKTYYACSRYVIAKNIMNQNDNDIFIMDADFFINDELETYLSKITAHDLSIPFSPALLSLFPWRRIMAGYVFLKNNSKSHEFLNLVRTYIINNLDKENSWTLDQNALTYAYEKIYDICPDINIGNSNKYDIPMSQPLLRKLIERI